MVSPCSSHSDISTPALTAIDIETNEYMYYGIMEMVVNT